jgi:Sec-independent protein translocase protein TatA
MEILGVGVPELAFIVLIALILLGPKDMIAAGRTIGRGLRKFLTSPTWLAMRRTGEELQQLPTKLVREAGLEDLQKDVQGISNQIKPLDLKHMFDERQIFDPNLPKSAPLNPDPPSSLPEVPAPPAPINVPSQPATPPEE